MAKKGRKIIGIISKAEQLIMLRRARRSVDIASGINSLARGTGPWGGTKRQQQRRDRRLGRKLATDFRDE